MTQKRVTLLGSTGSIGTQALQIIDKHPDKLCVHALVCHRNTDLLIQQALKYTPRYVVIGDTALYATVKEALRSEPIQVLSGNDAICEVASDPETDIVLTAMVGFAGLLPTIAAIKSGRMIALANKETLVVGGELIMKLAKQHVAPIIPVDSEHSAIFQCIVGEAYPSISKIFLTASGGPFIDLSAEELKYVTPQQALLHPNWNMGPKVTIDSSTLMNKGFEMIEAHWLFGLAPQNIEVVVHRQSIVHSMVQFKDNSIKAQLSVPDMRLPIGYALLYPNRNNLEVKPLSIEDFCQLTFEPPRRADFRCLNLAYEALDAGGTAPCVLNAANEIAVERFLHENITYTQIPMLIDSMLNKYGCRSLHSAEQLSELDAQVRTDARKWKS